jgi:hypothetical protein
VIAFAGALSYPLASMSQPLSGLVTVRADVRF